MPTNEDLAHQLEQSIAKSKQKFTISLGIFNSILYGIICALLTHLLWDPGLTWGMGFIGAMLGPVIAIVVNEKIGGTNGSTKDFILSSLAPLGVVLVIAIAIGGILLFLSVFVTIGFFWLLGAILGGG